MTSQDNWRDLQLAMVTAESAMRDRAVHEALLPLVDSQHFSEYWNALSHSQSQLRQDLFALVATSFKRGGFFVEFGATNGFTLSNTFLLERHFGWSGILAEPARHWHRDLQASRSAAIETSCIHRVSGSTAEFLEASEKELSTIASFAHSDSHAHRRSQSGARLYQVDTLTLTDLLKKHSAPEDIDFISIDTEGSEFEILSEFDFDLYRFKVLTIEHNYTSNRDLVFDLLTRNGYVRVHEAISLWDDWYVSSDLAEHLRGLR